MIGNVVGNYKVIEKIGEGGMGAVYKGVDMMLEREVAIKVLRAELARQPELVERFRTEAVTLAKLNHPNVATLFSFFRQGDDFFMVMEFVRGQTLDERIRQSGAMPANLAIPLFCQALDGLEHAHRMGIVHRDIKPANIMLTLAGSIKIMDFGIARVLGTVRMTRHGSVIGTIEYMSPEQVKGEETDARSDLYSMGILLYEMLTGRVPFSSHSEYELMRAQIESMPPPPTSFASNIVPAAEFAILRSLAKNPAERFQSAAEFRSALIGLVEVGSQYATPEIGIGPALSSPTSSRSEPTPLAAGPVAGGFPSSVGSNSPAPPQSSAGVALKDIQSAPIPGHNEVKETRIPAAGQPWPNLYGGSQYGGNQRLKETRLPGSAPDSQPYNQQFWPQAAAPLQRTPLLARLNWKHYTIAGVVLLVLLVFPFIMLFMLKDQVRQPNAPRDTGLPGATTQPPVQQQQAPAATQQVPPQTQEQPQLQATPALGLEGVPGGTDPSVQDTDAAKRQRAQKEAAAKRDAAAKEKARRRAAAERALDQ